MNKPLFFFITLLLALCSLTAQEPPINRFLKIELSEDDYEILNVV